MALDNIEMTEQLFEAIDTIVSERIKNLPYDKTLIARITNVDNAAYGKFEVTTDTNIVMTAYSERQDLVLGDWVYVKVPQNDYTKLKIITEKYIPDNLQDKLMNKLTILEKKYQTLFDAYVKASNQGNTEKANQYINDMKILSELIQSLPINIDSAENIHNDIQEIYSNTDINNSLLMEKIIEKWS